MFPESSDLIVKKHDFQNRPFHMFSSTRNKKYIQKFNFLVFITKEMRIISAGIG